MSDIEIDDRIISVPLPEWNDREGLKLVLEQKNNYYQARVVAEDGFCLAEATIMPALLPTSPSKPSSGQDGDESKS